MSANYSKTVKKKRVKPRRSPLLALLLAPVGAAAFFCLWHFAIARPSVTLIGSENLVLSYGTEYEEKGASASFLGRDVSEQIEISGEVDTATLGVYELVYTYKTPPFGLPVSAYRSVTVEDRRIPELSLNYTDDMTIDLGSSFVEPGYTAWDNYDGDLTSSVEVEGEVDASTAGVYELIYSVSDSNGNRALATRRVTVAESSPLSASLADFSLEGYFPTAILPESEDAGEEYILDTIFVGDSITQNYARLGNIPYENVWYKASINPLLAREWTLEIDGAESGLTLIEAAALYKPRRIVTLMGVGCVGYMSPEEFTGHYRSLIEGVLQVSPDTELIVQSVYPLVSSYDLSGSSENNTKINAYNYYLAEMCADMGLKFLNVAEILKNEEGYGPDDYFIDGFHPTAAKNDEIMLYIRTHAPLD
ncbi:MAG: DUF5011 domain-containing protein [Oscillospiraceae bacterium]|nr:DUF5011 domain-containing protein [Oscillospiraceae bacterium]